MVLFVGLCWEWAALTPYLVRDSAKQSINARPRVYARRRRRKRRGLLLARVGRVYASTVGER